MSRACSFWGLAALGVLAIGCADDSPPKAASTIATAVPKSVGTTESTATTPATNTATTGPTKVDPVVIHMVDSGFDMPSVLQGPLLDIEVVNDGALAHELAFAKIAPGTTAEQVIAALKNHDEGASFLLGDPGGINLLGGHERLRYERLLEPGSYIAFCPFATSGGGTHMEHGMYRTFTVSDGSNGHLLAADRTVTLSDDGIGLPKLSAGTVRLAIINAGSAPHELYILGVPAATDAGTDIDGEVGSWIEGGQVDPAPREAHFPGGHQSIAPGETVVLTLTLRAGYRYQFEDFGGSEPHVATATT